ncbi:unnamed protein product [Prorocentrum cordatum]|uniref:Uncharacterized protein n=1 Tax=Prorocentrum cordatum TaxID=2364126 RepID=A0ABN9VLZ5_9DINO|nr:unnamed protein product [Polarella glacialis]
MKQPISTPAARAAGDGGLGMPDDSAVRRCAFAHGVVFLARGDRWKRGRPAEEARGSAPDFPWPAVHQTTQTERLNWQSDRATTGEGRRRNGGAPSSLRSGVSPYGQILDAT